MIITMKNNMDIKQTLGFWAVLSAAMMGAAVTTLMPLMVGAFTDSNHFSAQQIGWLTAADVAGILITSSSAFFWVRRCHWQKMVIASLAVFIAANVITGLINDFNSLVLIRFIAGIACGVSYSIALAALGDRDNADKAFSIMVTLQVIYGTIGFALLPMVINEWGYAGIFHFFNVALVIALAFALVSFPCNHKTQHNQSRFDIKPIWKPTTLIFLGVVSYYFAQGTIWAYLERIGVNAGLTGSEVGYLLGLGFAISAIGSWLSGWSTQFIGRAGAIWLTVIIQMPCLIALLLMNQDNAWLIYAIATIIYQIFWSYIIPIMMAIFNEVDKSGRLIVLCVAAFKVGLVLGTPIAGMLVEHYSLNHVIVVGGIAILISGLLTIGANTMVKSKE
ncbi:MFS transporter [Paraferrimonas sp. SM1919]|uniref:MFS transporter n=1 Tax=Paraferrimonas sp. SM1919 TaxID=2662263 RepID=UPI0013D5BE81|nr:MFS transporter [Paraferrimonas sp. SM1919]